MIQVLHRATRVLEIAGKSGRVSLGELSAATGLRKTTLCNILRTLTDLEWLVKDETGRYLLGPCVSRLAAGPLRLDVVRDLGKPFAVKLAQAIQEGVVISILQQDEVYVLVRIVVGEELVVVDTPHRRPTPYGTPTGRLLLAHLTDRRLQELVAARGLPGADWPGKTSLRSLQRALAGIRRCGQAEDISADGRTCSVGVPVFGPDGDLWAAMGVFLPKARFVGKHKTRVVAELHQAAKEFSQQLAAAPRGKDDRPCQTAP